MNVRFFDPGLVYQKSKKQFDTEIQRVLSKGDLILREDVEKFERNLAKFVGTKYAVALNSGTDALYLALLTYKNRFGDTPRFNILPEDRVAVPDHTFVATAQVVQQLGWKPALYKNEEELYDFIKNGVRIVMVAHIAGEFAVDMEKLMKENVFVIEDACQSLGAEQGGKKAGAWGHAGAFSFYPAKILGAFGDAGGLVTNDAYIANEVRELRNHYKKDYSKWGINSRLDNLQAAILNIKIATLDKTLERRKQIAEKYLKGLKDIKIGLPNNTVGRVWQDFVIRTHRRDELYDYLKANGIETMKNEYPFPIEKSVETLDYELETLRLPINEALIDKEIDYVIKNIQDFYARA